MLTDVASHRLSLLLASCLMLVGALVGCSSELDAAKLKSDPSIAEIFAEYRATMSLVQARMAQIQNFDGGWDWFGTPAALESSTASATSAPNMFGVCAMGVLSSYALTGDSTALQTVQKSVDYLMARPLSRTQRLYANDCELLIRFGLATGNATYSDRGKQGQVYEKEFLAAVSILGTTSPSDAQVNSLTAAQIAGVSDATLAAAARARFVAGNRNASIRAFDWNARIRVALARGDSGFAAAMASVSAADLSEITQEATPNLLGLAATISNLAPFKDNTTNAGLIAQALLDLNELTSLGRLLAFLKPRVSPTGSLIDTAGNEYPEFESELLTVLANILSAS